jgi:hypothetical protein
VSGNDCSDLATFEVLTGLALKITGFWHVAPRSPVDLYEHSGGMCSLHSNVDLVPVTTFASASYELHSISISLELYPGGTRFKI